jgi:predicted peptidase
MMHRWALASFALLLTAPVFADGPKDNLADKVRRVPPPGVKVDDSERQQLETDVAALGKKIQALKVQLAAKPALLEFVPDVEIYHKAVDWALKYDQVYDLKQLPGAKKLLAQGLERAAQLEKGQTPWNTATGLVVRGYLSKIDGSVQPYGLVVPAAYRPGEARHRLDFWFHGRGETLSELAFILGRQSSPGEFTPANAFVLHPYGRYCCANKLAGEVDLFEALEHAKKHYPIDEDRIAVRGFSMGGAACWQFAVHYPGLWAAAAPGAGFSETPDFLKVFQNEKLEPTWYEKKLWHMYDCTDYAINLFNLPTVAYSGEKDSQKQAADMMAKALKEEGIDLVHIIGPGMGHAYHPDSKKEINRRIDAIVAQGRQPMPNQVHFTTWTLRYNQAHWVRVDGMGKHWERARIDAAYRPGSRNLEVQTKNVTDFTLAIAPGRCPFDKKPVLMIDGQLVQGPDLRSDRSYVAHFGQEKNPSGRSGEPAQLWRLRTTTDDSKLHKRHGLQGPIDDAFLSKFLMVKPTGKPMNEKVGAWAAGEMEHAREQWRQQFRGDAPVKDDSEITDADIASSNLILWGDPASNKVMARLIEKLPVRWTSSGIQVGDKTYAGENHVPLLIYPNPLNPKKYVVLNSGFTYREYDYLNNARQVPKLPDFAVVDVNTPPSSRYPGKVVDAGFFDEEWKLSEKK